MNIEQQAAAQQRRNAANNALDCLRVTLNRNDIDIAELQTAAGAAKALVDRLDEVHQDPRYMGVWQLFMIHGGNYTGPKYEHEFDAAKAAIAAIKAPL